MGGTVLVVDDEYSIRNTLCRALRKAGYNALQAENGRDAIAVAAKEERIDIVITDMVMPGSDGVELIQAIRQVHPAAGIIAMSGGGRISPHFYLVMAKTLGVNLVREKPISNAVLLQDIADMIANVRR